MSENQDNQQDNQQKYSLKMQNSHCQKNTNNQAPFYASKTGSLTVETAVVLPLFLATMFTVLFFFRFLQHM